MRRYLTFALAVALATSIAAEALSPNPPRFCILDNELYTGQEFMRRASERLARLESGDDPSSVLQSFFAYGRDRGMTVLPGLGSNWSTCARLPLHQHADWACWLRRAGGILKFDKPFDEVQTIWLNQQNAMTDVYAGEMNPERVALERSWLRYGIQNFDVCIRGCDCLVPIPEQPTLCNPNDLVRILNANAAEYAHKKGDITLIVNGHDKPQLHELTHGEVQNWVRSGWFRRIFFEGVTTRVDGIDTAIKVLDQHYMLGREREFLSAVLNAHVDDKPYLALGAWGKRGKKTSYMPDSLALGDFLSGVDARFEEEVAMGMNTTDEPWVQHKMFTVLDYFRELSKYKFLIAPKGGGVQSPKFVEALMVQTIPVTKRYTCFEDLQSYGMPMVLVDEWEDLTPELLEEAWEHYRPVLERARWIGTVQGVESLYYGRCTD